jgi:hypothetical protein
MIQAHDLAVDLRGQDRLGKPRSDVSGDLPGGDGMSVLFLGAVGENNVEHDDE